MPHIRTIMAIEKQVIDLHKLSLTEPQPYDAGRYKYRFEIQLTDGFRIGYVFPEITTERELIDTLRKLASDIEQRNG